MLKTTAAQDFTDSSNNTIVCEWIAVSSHESTGRQLNHDKDIYRHEDENWRVLK